MMLEIPRDASNFTAKFRKRRHKPKCENPLASVSAYQIKSEPRKTSLLARSNFTDLAALFN